MNRIDLRIFSGIEALDALVGGFRPGELIVLSAETGMGTSLFAAQIKINACRAGHHVLFCTLERRDVIMRQLISSCRIDPTKARRTELLTKEEVNRLKQTAAATCDICRFVDGELTLRRICRVAWKMRPGLIVLDCDGMIYSSNRRAGHEYEERENTVRIAKALAVDLRCPVIFIPDEPVYHDAVSIEITVERPYVRNLAGDESETEMRMVDRDGKLHAVKAMFNARSLAFEGVE